MNVTRAQSRQMLRHLSRDLKSLYQNLDESAIRAIQQHEVQGNHVSCRQGCDACCHIAVVITKVEAMVIADRIHSWPDWREWPARLASAAQPYCAPEYDRNWYANARPPCPFLAEHQCRIYDIRPAPCRYYYVITPAEQCGDRVHLEVGQLDMTEIEMRVLAYSNSVMGEFTASCLPLMVLEAMINVGWSCGREHQITPATAGLPSPMKWMADCIGRDTDKDLGQDQAVRRAWTKLKAIGLPGTEG